MIARAVAVKTQYHLSFIYPFCQTQKAHALSSEKAFSFYLNEILIILKKIFFEKLILLKKKTVIQDQKVSNIL